MATDIIARGMAEEALTHFVAGSNIVIQDESDGTQSINASGSVSANDDVARANIANHIAEENNPHSVTKAQVGLGNCNNTSDLDKPISTAAQTALDGKSDEGHTHTKSEITDFPTSMPASDVSAWAKATVKPTYAASEVGAVSTTTYNTHTADTTIHATADGKTISNNNGVLTANYSNDNIADNPWFAVNQRIVTTATVGEYIADRWKVTSGTATRGTNGVTLNGTMTQVLENAVGTNVTASINMLNGTAEISYNNTTKTITVTSTGGTINAVKLEYGHFATPITPSNIAEDTARCQRYLLKLAPYEVIRASYVHTNYIDFSIPTPVTMRPTTISISGTADVIPLPVTTSVAGFEFAVAVYGMNQLRLRATKQGHGLTDAILQIPAGDSMLLSAEL